MNQEKKEIPFFMHLVSNLAQAIVRTKVVHEKQNELANCRNFVTGNIGDS